MSVEWCRAAVDGPHWAVRHVPGGCLRWMGRVSPDKRTGLYCPPGTAWRNALRAHRIAWVAATGREIPETAVVWHTCGDRACVAPWHLRLGSQGEHNAVKAGASVTDGPRGERVEVWLVLTEEDARRVRARMARRRRAAARKAARAAGAAR